MSVFSFSTTIAQNLTDHFPLVKVTLISPLEAIVVQPSPNLASWPFGWIGILRVWHNFSVTFYHNLEIVGQFYDKRFPVYDLLKIQRFCVICCRLNWVKKRWCIAYRFRALIIVYNNKYILLYGVLISLCSSYYVQKVLSRVFQTFANKR